MKTTILFITILFTDIYNPHCLASYYGDDNSKETRSAKKVQKERYRNLKQDQKYLKNAKKQYWVSQSKQVKKTIKQTKKRNKARAAEQTVFY